MPVRKQPCLRPIDHWNMEYMEPGNTTPQMKWVETREAAAMQFRSLFFFCPELGIAVARASRRPKCRGLTKVGQHLEESCSVTLLNDGRRI